MLTITGYVEKTNGVIIKNIEKKKKIRLNINGEGLLVFMPQISFIEGLFGVANTVDKWKISHKTK